MERGLQNREAGFDSQAWVGLRVEVLPVNDQNHISVPTPVSRYYIRKARCPGKYGSMLAAYLNVAQLALT